MSMHRLNMAFRSLTARKPCGCRSSASSNGANNLSKILQQVQDGDVSLEHAQDLIQMQFGSPPSSSDSPERILQSFANLDHSRSARTGFPEAVFGEGKTAEQIAWILDDMAWNFNKQNDAAAVSSKQAILATRVTPELYQEMQQVDLQHGRIEYHEVARIVTMIPSELDKQRYNQPSKINRPSKRIVVATAGTTDLPVAEEAAVTLEAAGCHVDRIADVGVAGLHRILKALPRLQDPNVGCVIVCAGMDGALPSVVGGIVSCPVIAVPTSIGYGISLGGISAMLTMLNSCAPGVAVQNIDNGFGAAAFAYKCITTAEKISSK